MEGYENIPLVFIGETAGSLKYMEQQRQGLKSKLGTLYLRKEELIKANGGTPPGHILVTVVAK